MLLFIESCRQRGCQWSVTEQIDQPVRVFQHGTNGEAVLELDMFTLGPGQRLNGVSLETAIRTRVAAWADSVHEYEDRRTRSSAQAPEADRE